MGSRGSVIPFFMEKAKSGVLPITDSAMTRFNISLSEGVDMVFWSLENALGGELFVPKIPSYRIVDVAQAIGPSCEKPIVGIRPGKKIHEEMITSSDSFTTIDLGAYCNSSQWSTSTTISCSWPRDKFSSPGFAYDSGSTLTSLQLNSCVL